MSAASVAHGTVPDHTDISASNHDSINMADTEQNITQKRGPTNTLQGSVQPFRFFDLPAEVRILILGHALGFGCALKAPCHDPQRTESLADVQLLATNRQMHTEASHVFYGHNVFHMPIYSLSYRLPDWIAHPEQIPCHLRIFRILVHGYWTDWYPRNQNLVDQLTRALALCSQLELLEIVFVFETMDSSSLTSLSILAKPDSSFIKSVVDTFSGIPCKKAVYTCDRRSQKYESKSRKQPKGFWRQRALTAVADHEELSVE